MQASSPRLTGTFVVQRDSVKNYWQFIIPHIKEAMALIPAVRLIQCMVDELIAELDLRIHDVANLAWRAFFGQSVDQLFDDIQHHFPIALLESGQQIVEVGTLIAGAITGLADQFIHAALEHIGQG